MSLVLWMTISVGIFSTVILVLVAALVAAESFVSSSEEVAVTINEGQRTFRVLPGRSLLTALSDEEIFLPSACGGKGTCGLCTCRVAAGGGEVLATEAGLLTRRQQHEGWRLACQVKVRRDMALMIPSGVFEVRRYASRIRAVRQIAPLLKEITLDLPEGFAVEPGAYLQIEVPPYQIRFRDFEISDRYRSVWESEGLFGLEVDSDETVVRGYSIANPPGEGPALMVIVRIALPPAGKKSVPPGVASTYLFSLKPGDEVRISGPYGSLLIKDTDREMVYIGGGAGMAPLRSHLRHLLHALKTSRRVSFWYGARSRQEIIYEEEFRALERECPNFSFHLALSAPLPEDRWTGATGNIHEVVYRDYLAGHPAPEGVEYYLCGPSPMTAAVREMLDGLGVAPEMIACDDFGA